MPLALQMLVENAVKHNIISSAKPLTIDIFTENNEYVVVRNNNQRKIKPEPGTHFGLQSLVNRYALMGAPPVIVEETPGFFTVKVPIL
jgi:two-component system LytT family sensor kinase